MILKIPFHAKRDQFTYIDQVDEVVGPRIALFDKEIEEFRDGEDGDTLEEGILGTISICAGDIDKPCSFITYRRRGKDQSNAIVYDDKVFLMNDEGKTIEIMR